MSRRVRHIVAVRFKPTVSDAEIAALMTRLSDLQKHLHGILDFGHRSNVSPEEPVVHGFKQLFWFDFEDEKSRDAYLIDPRHQAVGKELVTAADGGTDGIVVLDHFL